MKIIEQYPYKEFREYAKETLEAISKAFESGKRFVMVNAATGCHSPGTPILMFNGSWKNVENINVGDRIMGPDSTPRTVMKLFQGHGKMYRVSPFKGEPFTANEDHILHLICTNQSSSESPKFTTISVKDYINKSNNFKHLWKLWRPNKPIKFAKQSKPKIDPYLLGLFLGDGCFCKSTPVITTGDREIIDYVSRWAIESDLNIKIYKCASKPNTVDITISGTGQPKGNTFSNALRSMNLLGTRSGTKFIPNKYKIGSIQTRREILAGLIDTDGNLSRNCFDLTLKSESLIDDIIFIARSLGLYASKSLKVVAGTTYFRTNISGDLETIPTRLLRKNASLRAQKKRVNVSGFTIAPIADGPYHGFLLDKDHLYLLSDFTVTHNSGKSGYATAFARSEKCAILTPTKVLQTQYSTTPEFKVEYPIFGKSNYKCGLEPFKHLTVDQAICCSDRTVRDYAQDTPWPKEMKAGTAQGLKAKCANAGRCEYYSLIQNINSRPGAILNYDLFFHLKKKPMVKEGIDFGESIVFDEAHHLMAKSKSVFGYKIVTPVVVKLFGADAKRRANEEPHVWLSRLVLIASEMLKKESDLKNVPELYKFHINASFISQLDIEDPSKFFIDDQGETVEFKPLNFRYLKNIIFYPFKKILLLSATFPRNFCTIFDIKDEEIEIINVPSTFPKEKRPTYFMQDLPALNYKSELGPSHPTIKAIQEIIEKHKDDKGIVHCSNYSFFKQLKKVFKGNNRFVWVEQGDNKTQHLTKHGKSSKGSILVSPSMLEGVDLKDDLARFQIMVKLPFPTLDDYTRRMMAIYKDYYENEVATSIMQAYGRAVRSQDDHAKFYILDGSFGRFVNRKDLFSKYFMEAIKISTVKNLSKI